MSDDQKTLALAEIFAAYLDKPSTLKYRETKAVTDTLVIAAFDKFRQHISSSGLVCKFAVPVFFFFGFLHFCCSIYCIHTRGNARLPKWPQSHRATEPQSHREPQRATESHREPPRATLIFRASSDPHFSTILRPSFFDHPPTLIFRPSSDLHFSTILRPSFFDHHPTLIFRPSSDPHFSTILQPSFSDHSPTLIFDHSPTLIQSSLCTSLWGRLFGLWTRLWSCFGCCSSFHHQRGNTDRSRSKRQHRSTAIIWSKNGYDEYYAYVYPLGPTTETFLGLNSDLTKWCARKNRHKNVMCPTIVPENVGQNVRVFFVGSLL